MKYEGNKEEREASQEVMARAAELGEMFEAHDVPHDHVTVAALAFLAAMGAQKDGIPRSEWGDLAQAAWADAEQRIARGEW